MISLETKINQIVTIIVFLSFSKLIVLDFAFSERRKPGTPKEDDQRQFLHFLT